MNAEPDNIGANDGREALAGDEDLSLRLSELDQHLREGLAALRQQSKRLASIEQWISARPPGTDIVPETKQIWEDTVRRFTGSIDVRLDILENELGVVQDEMDQFRRDTMDRSDAGQRRSVRLYAMGQVFLGALIVALFLVARSVDERNPRVVAAEPATVGTPASPVTSGPASKLSPAVAKVIPQSLPHDEVPTGTATTVTPTPAPHSESDDRAGDVGATPARPQLPDGAQSPNKEQPSDRVPPRPAPRASEAERKRDQQRATAVAEPPRAREQEIPAADVEPALPSGGDDQQAPFATDRGQSPESTDMQQPHHPQEESQLPDNNGSAAFAQDGSSTPEASAKTNVPTEGRFALQLITFNNVSRARSFAREFDIIDDSRYMRVENGNRSWYSVLVGNYATRVEGQAAVDTLPARLRELDPWVRWLPAGARLISVEASSEAASSE